MSDPLRGLKSFLAELKRRRVYRVGAVYAGVSFLLLEGADLLTDALGLPDVVMTVLVVMALFGFPLALVLAWAFDVTPEGVRRTDADPGRTAPHPGRAGAASPEGERAQPAGPGSRGAGGAAILLGIGVLVAGVAGWWLLGARDGADRNEVDVSRIRSVAVLPLDNFSGEAAQEPFVSGMHEELINQLSRVGALLVKSRTSVMRYRGDTLDIPQIGRELGVDAILEGSVLRVDDEVRITVQLIHVPTDTHLWSESFTRKLRNVLALHSEVARAVADEVHAVLTPEEERRLTRTREVEPEALEHYVRGRYLWNQRRPPAMREALAEFRAALDIDPTYAEAWAGIADTYVVPAGMGLADDVLDRAVEAARRALALDSTLAEAHTSLAYGLAIGEWAWEDAERHFRHAVALNPSYATAHQWYAELLVAENRMDEAVASARRATVRDPFSGIIAWNLARVLYLARRPREALDQLEEVGRLEREQRGGDGLSPIAIFSWLDLGQPDSAWTVLLRDLERSRASAPARMRDTIDADLDSLLALRGAGMTPAAAMATAFLGLPEAGEGRAGGTGEGGAGGTGEAGVPSSAAWLLRIAAAVELGRDEHALQQIERRVEERALHFTVVDLAADPFFDPIRDDPRYREILRQVGLAEYWPTEPSTSEP